MLKKIKAKYHQHKLKRAQKREARHQQLYELKNTPSAYDEAILSWVTPEAIRHERGTIWKFLIGIALIFTIAWGIVYNAWTFSLAIGVFAVVYYLIHLEHPKDIEIKISNIGIKVGGRKYPYSRIKAFWLIYEPPYIKTLNLRVSGEMVSDITIQLNGQHPADVRQFLMERIPELEGQSEKLSDIFLRLFKI